MVMKTWACTDSWSWFSYTSLLRVTHLAQCLVAVVGGAFTCLASTRDHNSFYCTTGLGLIALYMQDTYVCY